MATNPPPLAARLAAVKACYTPASVTYTTSSGDRGTRTYYDGEWDDARLTALLATDPPGATVTVLCDICDDARDTVAHTVCSEGRCRAPEDHHAWTPTTARVTYERALTEEERTR